MKKIELHVAYFVLAFAFYFVLFSLVPYSWYVDVTKLEYGDICVGDQIVPVQTNRVMSWPFNNFGIKGDVWSQLVLFENDLKLETTIYRDSRREDGRVEFAYEPNSTTSDFDIKLSEPIDHAGVYGLNEWPSINPLPFIWVQTFIPAEQTKFNVLEC